MKENLIALMTFIGILVCTSVSHAWTGDIWGPISRDTINSIACEMVDSTWTPLNNISNAINGANYYAGTIYKGEAYCSKQPNQNWAEFLNSINSIF